MVNCFKVLDSFLDAKTWSVWRFIPVAVGGILIQTVFGANFTLGNLNPYVTSYMRYKGISPTLTYTQFSWLYVATLVGQGLFMSLSGYVEIKLGLRWAALFGCWCSSLGVFLTYFTINYSFGAVVVTQGFMFGVGSGLGYMLPISCAMRWLRKKPGLASGIVNCGCGGGALIFNAVQTSFINPENKKVQLAVDDEQYFDQPEIMERVPNVFLLLGVVYAMIQLVGCMLMTNPPPLKMTQTIITKEEGKEPDTIRSMNDDATIGQPLLGQKKKIATTKQQQQREHNVEAAVDFGDEGDISPLEVLKTKDFYIIFFMFFFNGLGIAFLIALYKAYGLSFINDDWFLSVVGTVSSVFNIVGRIVWGSLADMASCRVSAMCMSAMFTALMATLQVTEYAPKALFMIYVSLLIFAGSGSSTVTTTTVAKRFGKRHVTTNYGMLYISQVMTVPLTFGLSQIVLSLVGWGGVLLLVGGLSSLGFVFAWMFDARDKYGNDL